MRQLRKALLASLLALASLPALASYSCDGTGDHLRGTLTTPLNQPFTEWAYVKSANHPVAVTYFLQIGPTAGVTTNAAALATASNDNRWQFSANQTVANSPNSTVTIDGVWTGIVGVATNDTLRDVYVAAIGNTGTNTNSVTIMDNIDEVSLCENLADAGDATIKLAAVGISSIAWNSTQITDFLTATVVPTFTAGPTLGTPTDTTLPTTFTSDYTGNVYGTACPDGTAGNAAQTEAGQCTGGGAAPSSFTEAVVKAVGDGHTFTGLSSGTRYDLSFVIRRTNVVPTIGTASQAGYWPLSASNATQSNDGVDAGGDLAVTGAAFDADHPDFTPASTLGSIANADTTASDNPGFDTPPSVSSQSDAAYIIAYEANTDSDSIYCAYYYKDASTPTAAQIAAGTGAHGTATEATTGAADTITLTPNNSPLHPLGDIYCVVKDGSTYTAVGDGDLLDEFLDPPAGKQFRTLASVDSGSHCANQTPAVVAGDIAVWDTVTNDTGYAITTFDTCLISVAAGGDLSSQRYELDIYDVSLAAMYGEATFAMNDQPPTVAVSPGGTGLFFDGQLFELGADPDLDLTDLSEDVEGDAYTFSLEDGALPDDWALASNGVLSDGSPGACGEYDFTIRMTDVFGEFTDVEDSVNIGPLVPDVSGMTEAEAIAALEALCD